MQTILSIQPIADETDAAIANAINAAVYQLPAPDAEQSSIAIQDHSAELGTPQVTSAQNTDRISLANQLTYQMSISPGPLTTAALAAQVSRCA